MRNNPCMEIIPENMVKGKLLRGDILCSYIEKGTQKIGIRFYKFGGYEKKKGIKTYSTLMTKEILFPAKKRIGTDEFKKFATELQSLEKGFQSDREDQIMEVDLDKLIKTRRFFTIR